MLRLQNLYMSPGQTKLSRHSHLIIVYIIRFSVNTYLVPYLNSQQKKWMVLSDWKVDKSILDIKRVKPLSKHSCTSISSND
jgi:hypothetical protein